MMVFNIGSATISICEDTAKCAVDNIQHDDVVLVAEFCDKNNYVVDVVCGDAAQELIYYTLGTELTQQELKKYIQKEFC